MVYCLVSTLKLKQISCEVLPVGTVRGCVCHSISKGPRFANTWVCVCLCVRALMHVVVVEASFLPLKDQGEDKVGSLAHIITSYSDECFCFNCSVLSAGLRSATHPHPTIRSDPHCPFSNPQFSHNPRTDNCGPPFFEVMAHLSFFVLKA